MMWQSLWQDLAFGARTLRKRPLLATLGVLTLALGIGANTLIFSVVQGVLLSGLPFPAADRLVGVFPIDPEDPGHRSATAAQAAQTYGTPLALVEGWAAANQVFDEMGAYRTPGFTLTGGDRPENVDGAYVSSGTFRTLGVEPLLGRALLPADDLPGAPRLVILSHAIWQRQFGADADVLGRQIDLNGAPHAVVGVMPAHFRFPTELEQVWANLADQDPQASNLQVVARMKPGVSLDRARGDMDLVAPRLAEMRPGDDRTTIRIFPLRDMVVGGSRAQLLMLFGAVGVVLLVACANLATLLLIRGSERRRELGIRTALGAGRGRLIRQLLGESLVLSLAGGALGCALAFGALEPFVALFPSLPRSAELGIDPGMLGFAVVLSLAAGLLSGTLPALRWSRAAPAGVLREGGGGATGGRRRVRTQVALVVAEITLAFVLLDGAGLFVQSFRSLGSEDIGFAAEDLATTRLRLPTPYRASNDSIRVFYRELLQRLATVDGVEAVGSASQMPFTTGVSSASFKFDNASGPVEADHHIVFASPGYFDVMGMAVTAGETFTWNDTHEAAPVALISRSMADLHFPGVDPVGRTLEIGWDDEPWHHTIAGVVEDVRYRLDVAPFPAVYLPFSQRPTWYQSIVLRTSGDPERMFADVRRAVWSMDPTMPVDVASLGDFISGSRALRTRQFSSVMVGFLAGVAALLAFIGIYGVLAAAVSQRRKEIGIRMALGATAGRMRRTVLRSGLAIAGVGLALGAGLAWTAGRLVESQLHGIEPTDAATLAATALFLTLAVIGATTVPARRATSVHPVEALRE